MRRSLPPRLPTTLAALILLAILAALAALTASIAGCRSGPGGPDRSAPSREGADVVLVTIDTLRAAKARGVLARLPEGPK